MTHRPPFKPLAAALTCALLAGCNLAPRYQAPELPVPETVAPPLAQGAASTDAVALTNAGPMQWQDFVRLPTTATCAWHCWPWRRRARSTA